MELSQRLRKVFGKIYSEAGILTATAYCTEEPVPFAQRISGAEKTLPIREGTRWGKAWDCAWIRLVGIVPPKKAGYEIALLLDVGGEACLFDEKGEAIKGFTNMQSEFSVSLGEPAKRAWFVPEETAGKEIVLWADAAANDLFGAKPENGIFIQASFAYCNTELRDLYYDLEVIGYLALGDNRKDAKAVFEEAMALTDCPAEAKKITRAFLQNHTENGNTVYALGHAHIDLAWLWPMRETKRKAARTLATVIANMERYPEYKFGVSQPQMLVWVREQYPDLYRKIKKLYEEGRVEILGGSWVEMDTNLPCGESLVRQMLYGTRFWEENFHRRPEMLWLPDTFGYCGQLPQLIRLAGMKYFLTIKLSWNTVNKFPYTTFYWHGIDGTGVLTHLPPEGDYNSAARPDSILRSESKPCSMMLFGIGDGGGGPGMEHLERLSREKNLCGLPKVRQDFASAFFHELEKQTGNDLPHWNGELYLERHQGTYTTHGKNKKFNRMCEKELHTLEFLGSAALRLNGEYIWNAEAVRRLWERVLLLQFHDILPGSSIDRVYRESDAEYRDILNEINKLQEDAFSALLKEGKGEKTVMNAAPVSGASVREGNAISCCRTEIPSLCFAPLRIKESRDCLQDTDIMENGKIRIRMNADGTLASVYGKESGREYLSACSNRLLVYEDLQDGWEVPDAREIAAPEQLIAESVSIENCPGAVTRTYTYRYGNSVVRQRMILRDESERIDFETDVDWKDSQRLLRVEFSPSAKNAFAHCGIQFGEIDRPTMHRDSWEAAKREICFQKYVDLSDDDCGCAVLSDSKYGMDVRDGVLSLALIRTPIYPSKETNLGVSSFTYALYPHESDRKDVVTEAYRLEYPMKVLPGHCDLREPFVSAEGLIVETVKPAENGDGIIVRLYNPEKCSGSTVLRTADCLGFNDCERVNLLEERIGDVNADREIRFGPYEILSFRMR